MSSGVEFFVRKYVSYRLGESYTGGIFVFSLVDVLVVFTVATVVCDPRQHSSRDAHCEAGSNQSDAEFLTRTLKSCLFV